MPYADPAKQKEANRRWYEKNREAHIARSKARAKADPERHRNATYRHRALYGRKDRPFVSDQERLHNYKPLQRWLEKPKLSPSIQELIEQAEIIWQQKEEKRKLAIIYSREKTRRYKAKLKNVLVVQVSRRDIRKQFALFENCCCYCGKSEQEEMLHIDHFISVSKGGTHVLNNLVPACKTCNFSKRNHHPEEWYKKQDFYCKQRWAKILKILGKKPETVDQLSFA